MSFSVDLNSEYENIEIDPNNNNNLLIGCSITRVVYIEVLITRCILYNTIKI